ncbi:MAG TPA: hypothetical protein DCZ55_11935 [Cyanobacteria bacterium UBA11371]|nr:hypothetical protein [Cyanobacteria bacterium UBA11371]HBE32434.1 hypothetical protein [Cyanobacteria bacterium UBA11368]
MGKMPLNGRQTVSKAGVQLTLVKVRFLHLPFSTGSREARHCADNAEVEGAVPSRWIAYN